MQLDWTTFAARRSAVPLWRQLVQFVQAAVADGRLMPGDGLPSEEGIADAAGVNRDTVRRALVELRALGVIETAQGIGSFVKPPQ